MNIDVHAEIDDYISEMTINYINENVQLIFDIDDFV